MARSSDYVSGLSAPANTPRGVSERRFLALMGREAWTFRALCDVMTVPNDSGWTVESWTMTLLRELRRQGSVNYDQETRLWGRTETGAAHADAYAAWVIGPLTMLGRDHSRVTVEDGDRTPASTHLKGSDE